MNTYSVSVIDGPLPADFSEFQNMEPAFSPVREDDFEGRELMMREPIFHRPEFGTSRPDFDRMLAPEFWEVGASGRRYSRAFVLDVLETRYVHPTREVWQIEDFACVALAPDLFLVTYTLHQGLRVTRRSTIWRKNSGQWQIVFHQGTPVGA